MSVPSRLARLAATAVISVGLLLGLGACQFQTLQNYVPADGVNVDQDTVKVRNLTVLVSTPGQGVLSGTVVADTSDRLTTVNGVALLPNGTDGSPLQSSMAEPVTIPANSAVVLTQVDPIRLSGADLKAGQLARVELTFSGAGTTVIEVPVLDKNSPEYKDLQVGPTTVPV
ncbi:hypothetical protein ACQCX2_09895 [Propionibacteriaceae bacterium Y1700]|uniref:hypothetical protein n=1 Tax=Microlunatus sp. Y1700 TaxID=3418487 RepID=UPI003DA6E8D6